VIFEKILIDPPYKKIYQRLSFKKKTTEISARQRKETDSFIAEASSIIMLKGTALRININSNDGNEVVLAGDITFSGKQLANFLRDSKEALLMGATASKPIVEAIKEKADRDNLAAAVVYDATASEMTDAALDWIMNFISQQLSREGKMLLTRRFSAGYADFELENQQVIYNQLQMEKIGVKINRNFILMPEKSVTAISGICG
jgi:hypothetical protein